MDIDQVHTLFKIATVVSFAIAILGAVGEVFGWWNDVGEDMIRLGTVVGVLLGLITVLLGATKGQVKAIAIGVRAGNAKLDVIAHGVGETNRKHDEGNAKLDQVAAAVAESNRKHDETNRKHDEGNAKLDQIVQLLRDIRDRGAVG